jgi:hypothetical protein
MLDHLRDTKTQTDVTVQAHLVSQTFEKGVEVPDAEMDALAVEAHAVCSQWSYTISPRSPAQAA